MKDRGPQFAGIGIVLLAALLCASSQALINIGNLPIARPPEHLRGSFVPVVVVFPLLMLGGLGALIFVPDPSNWRLVGSMVLMIFSGLLWLALIGMFGISLLLAFVLSLPVLIGGLVLLYQSTGVHSTCPSQIGCCYNRRIAPDLPQGAAP